MTGPQAERRSLWSPESGSNFDKEPSGLHLFFRVVSEKGSLCDWFGWPVTLYAMRHAALLWKNRRSAGCSA